MYVIKQILMNTEPRTILFQPTKTTVLLTVIINDSVIYDERGEE